MSQKKWVGPKRNWEGIQFEQLRRQVDPKFNQAHDALSKAFYEGQPFIWKGKNWGVLDKELFDKLHGLIFELRGLAFHLANKKQAPEEQIPEEQYNEARREDRTVEKLTDRAKERIEELKAEGIELEV